MQLLQRARMLLIKIVRDVLPLRGSFETIARSGMVLHHALSKLANTIVLRLLLCQLARLDLEQVAGSGLVDELGCRGGLSGRALGLGLAALSRRGRLRLSQG